MRRPPRPPDDPLFSGHMIVWSVLQGLFAFTLVASIYVIAFAGHSGDRSPRAGVLLARYRGRRADFRQPVVQHFNSDGPPAA